MNRVHSLTDRQTNCRGFFTIATGNEKYYKYASYLLKSYRLHNRDYPFAILCDREKEYTKDELKGIGNNVIDYIMSQSKKERIELFNKFSSITEKTVI